MLTTRTKKMTLATGLEARAIFRVFVMLVNREVILAIVVGDDGYTALGLGGEEACSIRSQLAAYKRYVYRLEARD